VTFLSHLKNLPPDVGGQMACSSAEQVEMRLKIFSERESATFPSCYFVSFVV